MIGRPSTDRPFGLVKLNKAGGNRNLSGMIEAGCGQLEHSGYPLRLYNRPLP
jgi:hypothetical protein